MFIKHSLRAAVIVNGLVHCGPMNGDCGKNRVKGMAAMLIDMNEAEQAEYYKKISAAITMEEMRIKAEDIVEEINYDDAEAMNKLFRNRDGSMETKTLRQKMTDAVKKDLIKSEEKKIIVGVK